MRILKTLRRLKKIAIYTGLFLLLTLITGVILSLVYNEEVKEFALKKIQEQLKTEFKIEETNLSIWKQFPNASLELKDFYLEDTFKISDTLIFAESAFLEFDILDLFSGNYIVKEVTIKNAQLNLKWDSSNEDNFHFWKSQSDSVSSFEFDIHKINLVNTQFCLDQKSNQFYLNTLIHSAEASGKFNEKTFDLALKADLKMDKIQLENEIYANKNSVKMDYQIKIDNSKNTYSFQNGEIEIDGLEFLAHGTISQNENTLCDLEFQGQSMPINSVKKLIPAHYVGTLQPYKLGGKFDAICKITGQAGNGFSPKVAIDFSLKEMDFEHYESGVSISEIVGHGHFEKEQDKAEILHLTSLNANFEEGIFSVKGSLENFKKPEFNIDLVGNINIEDFARFTENESLDKSEGQIHFNGQFQGNLSSLNPLIPAELDKLKTQARIELVDASFQLKNSEYHFEDLNGLLELKGDQSELKNIKGKLGQSDFALNGRADNLLSYVLIPDEKLSLYTSLESKNINFNEFLESHQSGKNDTDYNLKFPDNIDFTFDFNVGLLEFREFRAAELAGNAQLKNNVIHISPLEFKTSDGLINGSFSATEKEGDLFNLSSKLKIQDIDVNQLFVQFEEFNQDFLTSKNIKGIVSADINFSALMDSNLQFNPDNIQSDIDVKIKDGELIGLHSMNEICAYIKGNKLVAPFVNEDKLQEKLEHIYFSELSNKIEIRNQKIHIPDMNIHSSAMDISAQGDHYFNNYIEYTLGFKLRDVLCKENSSEFGEIQDDGLSNSFFLSMSGNTNSPEFGYDRLAHKEKRQADFKNEKTIFKELVKDQFRKEENKKSTDLIEKEPNKVTVSVDGKTNSPKEKKKKRWFEKDSNEKEEEDDQEFDDDDF